MQIAKDIEEKFISLGFKKEDDPQFPFSYEIVSAEVIEENFLEEDTIPQLLFGNTGINNGFCIYTGETFVWINATTPEEAIEFASKIVAFEPN